MRTICGELSCSDRQLNMDFALLTACTHEQHVERLLICQRHKLGKLLHGAKYDGKLSHGKSS